MFTTQTVTIVVILALAWMAQLLGSVQQMRQFNKSKQAMRRLGEYTSVGIAGNMYKRKVYTTLVVDSEGFVQGAERLSGFTIFARPKPVPALVGLHIDEIGSPNRPKEIDAKTWDAFDHGAEFIRIKLAEGHSTSA